MLYPAFSLSRALQQTRTAPVWQSAEDRATNYLAAHLTEQWTQSIWGQIGSLLAKGPATCPPLPRKKGGRKQLQIRLTPDQVDQLVADYRAGLSTLALAKKFHISPETAGSHLKRHGVQLRQPARAIPSSEMPTILEFRAQGWSYQQISKHYGCSHTTVRNTLRRQP